MKPARRKALAIILGAGFVPVAGCGKRSGTQQPKGATFPRQFPDPRYVVPGEPPPAPAAAAPAPRPDSEPGTRVFQPERRRRTRTFGSEPAE